MLRTIVRNVLSNWAGYLVSIVVAFFLSPYLVHTLGDKRYGTWTMIVAVTMYFRLLDLGVYQGVLQYVTRYRAQKQSARINEIVSTAACVLAVAAGLGILASAGLAWVYPKFVPTEGLDIWRIQVALLIVGASVSLTVFFEMFSGILVACQSFHMTNGVKIIFTPIKAGMLVWCLSSGMGLIAVAVVTFLVNFLGQLVKLWLAHREIPGLLIRPHLVSRSAGKELFGYGVWMFLIRVAVLFLTNIDLVIIGVIYGPLAATYYGIALSLITYAQAAMQGVSFTLIPVAIAGDAMNESWRVQSVLLRASRFGLIFGGTFFLGFLFWGEEFIANWMGPEYVSGETFISTATFLVIAAAGRVFVGGLMGSGQVLIATRRVRALSLVSIIGSGVSAGGVYLCAKYVDPIAAAVAMSAGFLVVTVIKTVYACRATNTGMVTFAREVLLAPLVALSLTAGACVAIGHLVHTGGWSGFVIRAGLMTLVAAVIGGYLCLKREERRNALRYVAARFRKRRKPGGEADAIS